MKTKRLVVLFTAFTLLFGASVYAESMWGDYNGFSKIKVRVEGNELKVSDNEVPALVMNERTMIPLHQVASELRSLVNWNSATQTVEVYKPNVNMVFAQDVSKEDFTIKRPFARVDLGQTVDFVVCIDVDNLNVPVDGFRVSIVAPNGDTVANSNLIALRNPKDTSFWYYWPIKVAFSQKGNYKVKFAFQHKGEFVVVSEKTIVSK
ncbi:MAG: hypothetical protein H7X86_10925 [Gorillibacterium sp.]|nr:hypothetical protein [Gorillibacterium sp.]